MEVENNRDKAPNVESLREKYGDEALTRAAGDLVRAFACVGDHMQQAAYEYAQGHNRDDLIEAIYALPPGELPPVEFFEDDSEGAEWVISRMEEIGEERRAANRKQLARQSLKWFWSGFTQGIYQPKSSLSYLNEPLRQWLPERG